MSENFPNEIIRKTSETVLHAAQKGKQSLFEKMTAKNAERVEALMKEKPIFHRENAESPISISLDAEIKDLFPAEFFANPTAWIEQQGIIQRGDNNNLPENENIEELWSVPYDSSKVKQIIFQLPDGTVKTIVSKRIEKKETEEVALAKKAFEADIPTPKVLGEVMDKGNVYAFFEHIPGINLSAVFSKQSYRYTEAYYGTLKSNGLNEKSFENLLQRNYGFLNKEEQKHLQSIREKLLPDIIKRRALDELRRMLVECSQASVTLKPGHNEYEEKRIKELKKDFLGLFQISEISEHDLADLTKKFVPMMTEPSIDSVIDSVYIFLTNNKTATYDGLMDNISNLDQELSNEHDALSKKIDRSFKQALSEMYWGFDFKKEKNRLSVMCEKAGIVHKDFANRNIVIPWDFENDRPAKTQSGKPKLYVIDWESKSGKSGSSQSE